MASTPITSLGFIPGQNLLPSRFSDAEIQEAELLVSQFLSDTFSTMDFVKGSVLYDQVVRPTSMIYLISRSGWDTLRATQSLSAVLKSPEIASNEIVDSILSNFQIERRIGSFATGRIKVVFSRDTTQSISSASIFRTSDGLEFKPTATFRIIADPKDPLDLKLTSFGVGQYYALVPVQSVERGAKYQISDGIPIFTSIASSFFIATSSFGNFVGGSDDESNEALINRLPEAMSVKNLSSRLSISATIKDRFPDVSDVSVQGAQDPAMSRNSHNVFGIKAGGFVDVYVKTASGILNGQLSTEASLVEIIGSSKAIYTAKVNKGDFPGHYLVNSVRSSESSISSFFIRSQVKDIDLDDGFGNIIPKAVEGVYSCYQQSSVFFEIDYDESLGAVPSDQFSEVITVVLGISYAQGIEDIQSSVSDRQAGVILADYLIKAAIPCFIELPTITIEASSYSAASEVKMAIYNYITALGIGATLKVDEMIMRIRAVPEVKSVRLPITVSGFILCPDGSTLDISSSGDLSIPYRPDLAVVPQNTAFFIELSGINVATIIV